MEIKIFSLDDDVLESVNDAETFIRRFYQEEAKKYEKKKAEIEKTERMIEELGLHSDPQSVSQEQINQMITIYFSNKMICKQSKKEIKERLENPETRESQIILMQTAILGPIDISLAMSKPDPELEQEDLNTVDLFMSVELLNNEASKKILLDKCLSIKNTGKKVNVYMLEDIMSHKNSDSIEYLYNEKQVKLFTDFNNELIENGISDLKFTQDGSTRGAWNFKTILDANEHINKYVQFIKSKNLSPFEAMLYIHKTLTARYEYTSGSSMYDGRILPSIVKDKKIVCSGYATMVKAIVDRLNMPGLQVDLVGCTLFTKSFPRPKLEGGHCHNLVKIVDPKYGIDGYYMEDACWDSRKKGYEKGQGFAHCLYPIEDLKHFSGKTIYVDDKGESRESKTIIDSNAFQIKLRAAFGKGLNKLFAKAEYRQYIRDMLASGIAIYDKYHNNSDPIEVETYKKGLAEMIKRCLEKPRSDEEIMKVVEEMMSLSFERHAKVFDKTSVSSFNHGVSLKAETFEERDNRNKRK